MPLASTPVAFFKIIDYFSSELNTFLISSFFVGDKVVQKVHWCNERNQLFKLRVTFDNFDFKMSANVILKDHTNSDFHWKTHFLTFDRVSSAGLNNTKLLANDKSIFSNSNYLLCKDNLEKTFQKRLSPSLLTEYW